MVQILDDRKANNKLMAALATAIVTGVLSMGGTIVDRVFPADTENTIKAKANAEEAQKEAADSKAESEAAMLKLQASYEAFRIVVDDMGRQVTKLSESARWLEKDQTHLHEAVAILEEQFRKLRRRRVSPRLRKVLDELESDSEVVDEVDVGPPLVKPRPKAKAWEQTAMPELEDL